MITEDYVSFEIAKPLKEKGFDIPCNTYFVEVEKETAKSKFKRKFCHSSVAANRNAYKSEMANHYYFSCPTIQMAMKWLREVHHITIGISFSLDIITYEIQKDEKFIIAIGSSRSYEDMVDEAIKYCLENLI